MSFFLEELLQMFVGIAADVTRCHAMVFDNLMEPLHDLLAPLFGERRDRRPESVCRRWRDSNLNRNPRMAFSIAPILRNIPEAGS